MEVKTCPNCNAEIRTGLIKQNLLITDNRVRAVNDLLAINTGGLCDKCYNELDNKIRILKKNHTDFINNYIHLVPVITTHTPFGWSYKPLGIVTGQSVTGTGVISEFTSGFTDFFGQQSGSFIRKIAAGEQMCLAQLRLKAVKMGGHAVIATDIDYGELGSIKGMIMVCAAGTAIELSDLSILGEKQKLIAELREKSIFLDKYSNYFTL